MLTLHQTPVRPGGKIISTLLLICHTIACNGQITHFIDSVIPWLLHPGSPCSVGITASLKWWRENSGTCLPCLHFCKKNWTCWELNCSCPHYKVPNSVCYHYTKRPCDPEVRLSQHLEHCTLSRPTSPTHLLILKDQLKPPWSHCPINDGHNDKECIFTSLSC